MILQVAAEMAKATGGSYFMVNFMVILIPDIMEELMAEHMEYVLRQYQVERVNIACHGLGGFLSSTIIWTSIDTS